MPPHKNKSKFKSKVSQFGGETMRSKSTLNQSKATWNRVKEVDMVSVMSQAPKFDPHSNYLTKVRKSKFLSESKFHIR